MDFDSFPFGFITFFDTHSSRRASHFFRSQGMTLLFCSSCLKIFFFDCYEFHDACDFCIQAGLIVEMFQISEIKVEYVAYSRYLGCE